MSPEPRDCAAGSGSGQGCRTLHDAFAALLSAHLQTVADLAWMRYELARLGGENPEAAIDRACDPGRIRPSLAPFASHGLDVDGFVSDLGRAVRTRAGEQRRGTPPS